MTDVADSQTSHQMTTGLGADQPVIRPHTGLKAKIIQWGFDHSEVFLSFLRDIAPILVFKKKKLALITRYDDVKEVFLADDDFGVPYGEKLNLVTGGVPFLLGMDDSQTYRESRQALRSVFLREDIERRLAPATAAAAEAIVTDSNGRMDTLQLTREATFEVYLPYFGTPVPSNGDIVVWSARLFEYLFHVGKPDPALDAEAHAYAAALLAHVQDAIETRRASGEQRDDVLGRCLAKQAVGVKGFGDPEIRGTLAGFIVAGLPQPAMVLPKVIEQLLRRPKILAQAQDAARRNDDARLAKYIFEAMRFDPLAPVLRRIAKQDHILGDGAIRAKKIEAGTQVLFFFASAMMDERRVSNPKSFDPDRPPHNYMLFGHGLHQCFGIHINERVLPLMLKPLLQRRGLRRANGPEGHLRKQLVYPDRLVVCFDA
jgi:cytochrome P450